ncbi:MAG: class I SAM-dependent methyltransferase [Anaerolineales bacterium]
MPDSKLKPPAARAGENPFIWPMLKSLPYFRGLLRAVEADFYGEFEMASPVLDLGCGDGHFASLVFKKQVDVGIDPYFPSLREAKKRGAYRQLFNSTGANLPFPNGHFASGFSNSVLEHIPHLQPVLNETARVLKPGAVFLFCIPNHRWQESLSVGRFLRRIGFKRLANAYVRFFTRISRHANMLSPEEWQARLDEAGFTIERYWHYFPPAALHALEWGHYFGLPSWVARALTGRWILAPVRWNLALTERLMRRHAHGAAHPQGTYTWYVARRK